MWRPWTRRTTHKAPSAPGRQPRTHQLEPIQRQVRPQPGETMTTSQIAPSPIGNATLTEFVAGLRGTAVLPGDAAYDDARSVWNGAHDRRPAVIARCAGVADVIRTVNLARSEGLALAVRGGGHSIPGFSTVDGGVLLDLSRMTGIEIRPE